MDRIRIQGVKNCLLFLYSKLTGNFLKIFFEFRHFLLHFRPFFPLLDPYHPSGSNISPIRRSLIHVTESTCILPKCGSHLVSNFLYIWSYDWWYGTGTKHSVSWLCKSSFKDAGKIYSSPFNTDWFPNTRNICRQSLYKFVKKTVRL